MNFTKLTPSIDRLERTVLLASSALLLAFALQACGGGYSARSGGGGAGSGTSDTTAPTATNNQTGATLAGNATIVIRFSESMDRASLQLAGTLAADSDGGVWSNTVVLYDTLTLSPKGASWTIGSTGTLSINAKDLAGNALPTLTASYFVSPIASFAMAATVIGAANFSTSGSFQPAPGASVMAQPGGLLVTDTGRLYIADSSLHRLLAFNAIPAANGANADFAVGKAALDSSAEPAPPVTALAQPQALASGAGKSAVADPALGGVLIYTGVPLANSVAVAMVGQDSPDVRQPDRSCKADRLSSPSGVAITPGGKLVVADARQNRVLIWNAVPTTSGQPADIVLGQAAFDRCAVNDDNQDGAVDARPSARTLGAPNGLWTDGQRLIVADSGNNRLLVWNTFPTSSFAPADVVVGQADLAVNAGAAASARTLSSPVGVDVSPTGILAVADFSNNRVLMWPAIPTQDFAAAVVVLGQSDFFNAAANDDNQDGAGDAAPSARTMQGPTGVRFAGNSLLVSDTNNNRVLVFRALQDSGR
jgi:hypothetical protein